MKTKKKQEAEYPNRYAIGTRAVVKDGVTWTVCCASCDGERFTFRKRDEAMSDAVRFSCKPCSVCGAS